MSGFSGVNGSVKIGSTAISEITKWSFKPSISSTAWNSSSTAGTKVRVSGVKDGAGSFEAKYDHTAPFFSVIDVGTSLTLKLYVDATNFYLVPAIIENYDVSVNVDTGEVVAYSASFAVNGAWTNPST